LKPIIGFSIILIVLIFIFEFAKGQTLPLFYRVIIYTILLIPIHQLLIVRRINIFQIGIQNQQITIKYQNILKETTAEENLSNVKISVQRSNIRNCRKLSIQLIQQNIKLNQYCSNYWTLAKMNEIEEIL
jgi:phenylacetate-coenzyme A ligase PaaK-like adenylate-forming protein